MEFSKEHATLLWNKMVRENQRARTMFKVMSLGPRSVECSFDQALAADLLRAMADALDPRKPVAPSAHNG